MKNEVMKNEVMKNEVSQKQERNKSTQTKPSSNWNNSTQTDHIEQIYNQDLLLNESQLVNES